MKVVTVIAVLFPILALPSVADEAAGGAVLHGEGWRLIEGSRSRDGMFGIAWGIQGKAQPGGEMDEEDFMMVDQETEGLTNYVVNLRSGTVVGKTAGTHFGDKDTYNHTSNEISWSASSSFFVQVCNGKWATFDANVYAMSGDQMTVSTAVDLLEPAKMAAFDHLAGEDFLKKFGRDAFAITVNDVHIVWRGGSPYVVCEVNGQIPKSEEEGAYFGVTVTFRLTSDENDGPPVLSWSSSETHRE